MRDDMDEVLVRMAVAVHLLIEEMYTTRDMKFPVDSLPEECILLMEKLSDAFFHDGWDSIAARAIALQEEEDEREVGSSED